MTEVRHIRKLFEYDQTKGSIVIFRDNRKLKNSFFDHQEEQVPTGPQVISIPAGNRQRQNDRQNQNRK